MSDVMVVTSKIKALVKKQEMRTGNEFIEALSTKVAVLVAEAVTKAQADKRKTLKPEDLS